MKLSYFIHAKHALFLVSKRLCPHTWTSAQSFTISAAFFNLFYALEIVENKYVYVHKSNANVPFERDSTTN